MSPVKYKEYIPHVNSGAHDLSIVTTSSGIIADKDSKDFFFNSIIVRVRGRGLVETLSVPGKEIIDILDLKESDGNATVNDKKSPLRRLDLEYVYSPVIDLTDEDVRRGRFNR